VACTGLRFVVGASDPNLLYGRARAALRLAGEPMSSLDRSQPCPRSGDVEREPIELFEVECGERLEPSGAFVGEAQSDDAMVILAASALHEPGGLGPVNQPNRAVVSEEQVVSDFADGRTVRIAMTADRQEELMVRRSETGGACLRRAPSLEVPEAGSQGEKPSVGGIRQRHS